MNVGIIGPISKDRIVLTNDDAIKKFGAVVYTTLALAKLLEGTDSKVICISRIPAEDHNEVNDLLRHPNIILPALDTIQTGTEIELRYINEQERVSRQKSVMSPIAFEELQLAAGCDYVLFMPLNDTDIPLKVMQDFRKISHATVMFDVHGMVTGVDENGHRYKKAWDNVQEWLPNIDIIKMNDKEAVWVSGLMINGYEDYINYAVDNIKLGLAACWITFGNQSSLIAWRRERRILWASVPVADVAPVVDTIGCGDTASAGFLYLYAKIQSPLLAVISGNMMGSVKASVYEASQFPTRSEVRELVSKYYYDYLHRLLDQLLSLNQLIIHEVKEDIDIESVMHSANGYSHDYGADHAGSSHS